MTQTAEVAALIERLNALAADAESNDDHGVKEACDKAATTLRTLLEHNAALKRERNQLLDKLHCMCGSSIDHSAWEGHTPVSVYDYSLDQERSRAEAAEAERDRLKKRVAELEKALEPFAREAEDWSPEANGGLVFDDAESIAGETSITVGHLRTARAYRDKGRE